MGGESKQETTQSSTTAPWLTAQPALQGILGQINSGLGNTGLTGQETGALNSLESNAGNANQFGPQITSLANSLLSGGGANDQAGNIQGGLSTFQNQLAPYANGSMIGKNPALQAQLDTIMSDVGNSVNGQFAAAGRDFSGANQQAYGRGVAQGVAPVLANQYNQDVNNQINAAGQLYGAQNTTSGLLAGLNQQGLANQQAGVTTAGQAVDTSNAGANQILAAEAARRGIPVQALGLLAQIGIPIAGLGSQNSGQAQTTKQDSGATQFGQIAGGIGSLFSGGGGSAAGNIFKMFSDRRLKKDIEQVGALFDGTPVYRFRYVNLPTMHIGLMSDEVDPRAVERVGNFDMVDYELATNKALEAA